MDMYGRAVTKQFLQLSSELLSCTIYGTIISVNHLAISYLGHQVQSHKISCPISHFIFVNCLSMSEHFLALSVIQISGTKKNVRSSRTRSMPGIRQILSAKLQASQDDILGHLQNASELRCYSESHTVADKTVVEYLTITIVIRSLD